MRKILLLIIFCGGGKNTVFAQYWSALGNGIGPASFHEVRSLATYNNELYAGGYFNTAGNLPANNIVKWNGISWSALSGGINGGVHALCVYNGELYAGGSFSTAGNTAANDIARWNGTNWANVGSPDCYSIKSLVEYNGELYAAGYFIFPNSPDGTAIAKWNGNNWTSAGLEDSLYGISIECMTVYNGELYAAGAYYEIGGGGMPVFFRIVKWNGTAWSTLGTINPIITYDGALGNVYSMIVYNSELYVGGSFYMIDSIPANQIAKWDGVTWSPVGTGINPEDYPLEGPTDGAAYSFVGSLAMYGGALYAGGHFDSCGMVTTRSIAKWNGTNWSALGDGVNGLVFALLAADSSLYTGGSFDLVNGTAIPANNIAKWSGVCPGSPSQPGIINGNNDVCNGSTQTYSINPVAGASNYTWVLPPGWSGSSTSTTLATIVGTNSGVISVTANNACGSSVTQVFPVTVKNVPQSPGNITGNNIPCDGSELIYSVGPIANAASYSWILPSAWTGNSQTNSISVVTGPTNGIISVVAINNCGSSAAQVLPVTVKTVPAIPTTIIGSGRVCEGSSQTYSISQVPGATGYAWDLSFGWAGGMHDSSITITVDQSSYTDHIISVSAYNDCGYSDIQVLPVTVIPLAWPDDINGNTKVCRGSSQTYFTQAFGATNFIWTIPPGWVGNSTSNSIIVTAGNTGGFISVKASNDCGTSITKTITVSVDSLLPAPGPIAGNMYVTTGHAEIYSIDNLNGVNNYSWSLSGGGTLIQDQSQKSVTVKWDSPGSYTLNVKANNSCGAGVSGSKTIIVAGRDDENLYDLKLFPNPSNGEFYITAKRLQDKFISIEVLNMLGQPIFRQGKSAGTNNYSQLIDLKKYAKGIYVVKIIVDNDVHFQRIILND